MQNLAGKTALITGATSGIGKALAHRLSQQGLRLALVGRSAEKLDRLKETLGGQHVVITADLTEPKAADLMIAQAFSALGEIDILAANAGLYLPGDLTDTDPEAIETLVNVNVTAVFRMIRAALPKMVARGSGDILVTSSVSGHQAIHWEPVYSASKHAIQSFCHGLRRQTGKDGVRVMSLAPGVVLTELWGEFSEAEIRARVAKRDALTAENVVDSALFMLQQPANVTIRDLVILPAAQDI